jgi:glycosyltransferase involved in cell wall biosynthesis
MISVVIPAYNEEKNIQRCLEAFEHQKTTRDFEIILVDNNSSDKTVTIAKTFLNTLPLSIVSEKEKGRGHARSAGFAKAKGSIILSTDADAIVPPNWIEQMAKALEDPTVVAVTGTGKMIDAGSLKNTLATYTLPLVMHIYALLHRHYWLTGFNFGIRKDIYQKSGGFRQINGLEDIDLGFRVRRLGKIKYKPIWVYMSGRRFTKSITKGLNSYTQGYVDYMWGKKQDVYLSDIRD